jgi:hypothetical protein
MSPGKTAGEGVSRVGGRLTRDGTEKEVMAGSLKAGGPSPAEKRD